MIEKLLDEPYWHELELRLRSIPKSEIQSLYACLEAYEQGHTPLADAMQYLLYTEPLPPKTTLSKKRTKALDKLSKHFLKIKQNMIEETDYNELEKELNLEVIFLKWDKYRHDDRVYYEQLYFRP